jgi:hypothetical protein
VRILSHCGWWPCSDPVIAGGVVAWIYGRRAEALVLRSGRKRTWRIPSEPGGGPYSLALSRRHIYVFGGYDHAWRGTLPGR